MLLASGKDGAFDHVTSRVCVFRAAHSEQGPVRLTSQKLGQIWQQPITRWSGTFGMGSEQGQKVNTTAGQSHQKQEGLRTCHSPEETKGTRQLNVMGGMGAGTEKRH